MQPIQKACYALDLIQVPYKHPGYQEFWEGEVFAFWDPIKYMPKRSILMMEQFPNKFVTRYAQQALLKTLPSLLRSY